VESQMAALVVPGAPVSVLIDHGVGEELVERLMAAGVTTVERLGSMTPEELDQIGVDQAMVEQIQLAVNGYYGQFEEPAQEAPVEAATAGAAEETAAEAEAAPEEGSDTIENTEHPRA